MTSDKKQSNPAESTVHLYMGDIEIQHLPEDIELSTEGIRFKSTTPIEPLSVVELDLEVPQKTTSKGMIACAGLVVECKEIDHPETPYSILVKFMSVPSASHRHLESAATQSDLKCPFKQAS